MQNKDVQNIAKKAMACTEEQIRPGMTLAQIRALCEQQMYDLGADSFWYYGIGAFVFCGKDTVLSVSGRDYKTPQSVIQPNDIVTLDLSPQAGGVWGDYARTVILENGRVVPDAAQVQNPAWKTGLLTETFLHEELLRFARPGTTFEELYVHMNAQIREKGFVNLDFHGNLGHSIEKRLDERIYTEKGNNKKLADVPYFTFEPHIAAPGTPWGFKKEDIYFFNDEKLQRL